MRSGALKRRLRLLSLVLAITCLVGTEPVNGQAGAPDGWVGPIPTVSGSVPSWATPLAACSLVPQQDVQRSIPESVVTSSGAPTGANLPSSSTCTYPMAGGGAGLSVVVVAATATDAPTFIALLNGALQNPRSRQLQIGEGAFMTSIGQVFFIKDNILISVAIIPPQFGADAIATTIADRLTTLEGT
jgi:hypothetical protein